MTPMKILYAHGFASGPLSKKGVAVRDHLVSKGFPPDQLELLDLRVPTPTGLRLSRMIEVVRAAAGPRTLVIGSSLGGLACARAAELARADGKADRKAGGKIVGAVLMAPAFRFADRWRARLGELAWEQWRREGVYGYDDHATGGTLDVDFGFVEDAARVDGGGGDSPIRDDAFPDVDVPTVVVHGVRDDVVDPWLSRTWAATRPNVSLVEVDDDHQLLASIPIILREIDRMLERLG